MPIILVRVDDRLIHGQIVEGWLKPINANTIFVISDEVAKDKMQQILLQMAVPKGIKCFIASLDEAVEKLKKDECSEDRVLVLITSPKYAKRLLDKGIKFESLNVGGMHFAPGKRQLLRTLSVNDEDVQILLDISKMNVELEGRVLPDDEGLDILDVILKEAHRLNLK